MLSIASKIFMAILNKRLYNWIESTGKLDPTQAGFRRDYSTTDHIFTITQIISNCLYGQNRSKCFIAFIDFKRAFDTVKRDKLWEILNKIGVSNKMLNMLQAIYSDVKGCVKYGGEISPTFECPVGLRQGCLLSPLLFSLMINEVADAIRTGGGHGYQFLPGTPEILSLMFADDMSLMSLTPTGLQRSLNTLANSVKELGLQINMDKTKIIIFRKGGIIAEREKWHLNGENIEIVNNYRYLGYTLSTKLSKEIALAEYVGKAKKRVFQIRKATCALGYLDYTIYYKLFQAQALPALLYASEVWVHLNIRK